MAPVRLRRRGVRVRRALAALRRHRLRVVPFRFAVFAAVLLLSSCVLLLLRSRRVSDSIRVLSSSAAQRSAQDFTVHSTLVRTAENRTEQNRGLGVSLSVQNAAPVGRFCISLNTLVHNTVQ